MNALHAYAPPPKKVGRKSRVERCKQKLERLGQVREGSNKELARLIVVDGRVDVLAELLGLDYHSFQDVLWEHQSAHKQTLTIGPRGWGKSVILSELKSVLRIIQDRNIRILIASNSADRAKDILTGIKAKLEHPRLVEIFGSFEGRKWAEYSIEVSGRTTIFKEPTIQTSGIGSSLASGHYDLILADDLSSLDNSKTQAQRDKVKTWFAVTLAPCVVDETTEFHVIGTRYHPDDLYNELIENPMFEAMVIPALNLEDTTNYPERFSNKYLAGQKITMRMGGAWESQMMGDPSSVQGDIFDPAFFRHTDEHPTDHFYTFTGVDLAVGLKDKHDKFAWVTIGVSAKKIRQIYVLDYHTSRMSVKKQDEEILRNHDKFGPLIVGIESNHFQAAKVQRLREHHDQRYHQINAVPIQTDKDKTTRAQLLAVRYERGDIIHLKHLKDGELEAQLKGFPGHRFKDLFDALDMAVRIVMYRRGRKKKKRKREPGLIRVKSSIWR